MEKVIPAIPCPDIEAQIQFYKSLGFELVQQYKSPGAYGVVKYGAIELHFYGNCKMIPDENATMCIIEVDDVDAICKRFSDGIKAEFGKIPRTGIPRISKVRDLKDDRRFTLTDTGGNTFYVCMPNKEGTEVVFRTISNPVHAKDFAVLYDLIYSKEDLEVAANMLSKLLDAKDEFQHLDKAKLLLLVLEIRPKDTEAKAELCTLIEKEKDSDALWQLIEEKLR